MKNLKFELFQFRKSLDIEQEDVLNIVQPFIESCDHESEKNIIKALNERLDPYTYDNSVKSLLESLNNDLAEFELTYELKDLYKTLERKNSSNMLYRQPINTLLNIIQLDNDEEKLKRVLNELNVYNYVPEIRLFISNLIDNPEQKARTLSGGNIESIYTIVESVEDGDLVYLDRSWFLLKEDSIAKANIDDYISGDKLNVLRTLENALETSTLTEDEIIFHVSESLNIGIGISNSTIKVNGEKIEDESTLESLFQSPIVPLVSKQYFTLIRETANNKDKFVELDVARKINNIINPYVNLYTFNYKNNVYLYRVDERYNRALYQYESAQVLVDEVMNEMKVDLSFFYEDKLSEEHKTLKKIELKEQEISLDIEKINKNIDKIDAAIYSIGESKEHNESHVEELKELKEVLKKRIAKNESKLQALKELRYKEVNNV